MSLKDYQDPGSCPFKRPALSHMRDATRNLHQSIDTFAQQSGERWLHPESITLTKDLLGGRHMQSWQERKGALSMLGEDCWSTLPQVYARYATEPGRELIAAICSLENARGVVVTDCGMQATAIVMDTLLKPKDHAIISRQVYNKSKAYLDWSAQRIGVRPQVVDEVTPDVLREKANKDTVLVFTETFSNPLMHALDLEGLSKAVVDLRKEQAPKLRLVVDNTIVTPWGVKTPILDLPGVHMLVSAGTKALGGEDKDMWGYIASNNIDLINPCMDTQAMRGGVLSWRSAQVIHAGLKKAESHFRKRCDSANTVAEFLLSHPKISEVFHPSVPDHPHRNIIDTQYALGGSLMSFRVDGLDEEQTGHFCDVLAMTIVPRYALSFDGLVTKLNHHKTVSEFYGLEAMLQKQGIDRLVRLGIGTEDPSDIIACLNWALWHFDSITKQEVETWQDDREMALRPS